MRKNTASKTKGFTLIELVVVIVILGILAVTAAPKFLGLSRDAKISALKGLEGAIKSTAAITYGKAAIAGVESNPRSGPEDLPAAEINGQALELKYGYPEAWADDGGLDIIDLIDVDGFKVCYSDDCDDSSNSSRVKIGYDTTEDTGCYVRYSEPAGTGAPSSGTMYGLLTVTEGC